MDPFGRFITAPARGDDKDVLEVNIQMQLRQSFQKGISAQRVSLDDLMTQ